MLALLAYHVRDWQPQMWYLVLAMASANEQHISVRVSASTRIVRERQSVRIERERA